MKTKIYISMLAGAIMLGGCSKDFLETEPTQYASADQIKDASADYPELQNANIAGLYTVMYTTGSGGTDLDHDDYGQKGYDVYSDMLQGDMVLAGYNYGWYKNIVEYTSTTDYTNTDNYKGWRYYYRIIFGANNVIEGLGGNDAEPESASARAIMGQAKAMRGYAYFYLANFYSEGYNPSEPILPIYTDVTDISAPLSPASDVYAVIVDDLTDAIDLLQDFSRTGKNQINQDVAKGLLAYAYAAMGDNEMAKQVTSDVINTGGYPIMTAKEVAYSGDGSIGGFNDVNTAGWMWGVDLTLDNGLDLVSWWGQVDIFTYSYAYVGDAKSISLDLYSKIPDNDVRKGQFQDYYEDGDLLPINKFYAPARTEGGQREVTTDYIYMRISEMYLLNAEAAAKTGDEPTAKESLKAVLSKRLDDVSYIDGLSGQALQDEIYLQTRIEFWGEGKAYLAMKRDMKTVTLGSNHLSFPGETISYDDDRMTFEIPQLEIQNNPKIN